MAFCKELEEGTATPEEIKIKMSSPEWERERRSWWESGIEIRLEDLESSLRRLKWAVFILSLSLVWKNLI